MEVQNGSLIGLTVDDGYLPQAQLGCCPDCQHIGACNLDFSHHKHWVTKGSVPRVSVPRGRKQKPQSQ